MIPSFFVLAAIFAVMIYKLVTLTVENRALREDNEAYIVADVARQAALRESVPGESRATGTTQFRTQF